jgi:hypothetical protein
VLHSGPFVSVGVTGDYAIPWSSVHHTLVSLVTPTDANVPADTIVQ